MPWLWLVIYVAFVGQRLGGQFFGGYLSGFIGAVAMTPVAYWIQRRRGAPPALVTFLPAFWLLVPGSLGLIGLTQLVAENRQAALQTVGDMTFAIVAIALGVMVGVTLVQPLGKPIGQVPLRTEQALGKIIGKAMVAVKNTGEAARSERDRATSNVGRSSRIQPPTTRAATSGMSTSAEPGGGSELLVEGVGAVGGHHRDAGAAGGAAAVGAAVERDRGGGHRGSRPPARSLPRVTKGRMQRS